MTRAYISIGSNQEPYIYVPQAIEELKATFGDIDESPVYESVAVGFDGENFINLVVGFDTSSTFEEVAETLDSIEKSCGRVRGGKRFGSRTMDLDLLLFGDLVRHDGKWDIPRAEIQQYAFVLKPLAELAPDAVHPELNKSFAQLWNDGDYSDQKLWKVNLPTG